LKEQKATHKMELSCPKCSMQLPEVENLEFRFCPGCGAEISAEPERLDQAFQTIPPDLSAQPPEQTPNALDSEQGQKVIHNGKFNDMTIAPQSVTPLRQPELQPPDTPPPSSFHRVSSIEKPHRPRAEEKAPPKRVTPKRSPAKSRNILIASLIILVLIVLVLGGLFTF
jgi:hypothetical protein